MSILRNSRINKELNRVKELNDVGFYTVVEKGNVDDSEYKWEVSFYDKTACLFFPENYPFEAPKLIFTEPIKHKHVSVDGKLIFEWSPAYTAAGLLQTVANMLVGNEWNWNENNDENEEEKKKDENDDENNDENEEEKKKDENDDENNDENEEEKKKEENDDENQVPENSYYEERVIILEDCILRLGGSSIDIVSIISSHLSADDLSYLLYIEQKARMIDKSLTIKLLKEVVTHVLSFDQESSKRIEQKKQYLRDMERLGVVYERYVLHRNRRTPAWHDDLSC